MPNSNSLINLGELAKPATALIEKISDAVGGVFKPHQIIRVAKAEAEADRISAESQIQITDLHRRAMHRFLEEEATKQTNIEDITQKALPLLEDNSSPKEVDDDWITNFFDKSRIVSDDDMQQLWAKILAGEANNPGVFSRKTVNLIADLDNRDAQLFGRLCGFNWMIGNITPLVFDPGDDIYNRMGITFNSLIDLESLGLIQFSTAGGFKRYGMSKVLTVSYFGKPVILSMPKESDNDLRLGNVLLTKAGKELEPVCGAVPIDGFFEFVYERWDSQSLVLKSTTSQADEPVQPGEQIGS